MSEPLKVDGIWGKRTLEVFHTCDRCQNDFAESEMTEYAPDWLCKVCEAKSREPLVEEKPWLLRSGEEWGPS